MIAMGALPVKFRIVQIIADCSEISNEELYTILKKEYPHDRHVSQSGIDSYLMSLKAVGIIEPISSRLTQDRTVVQSFKITATGISKMHYIKNCTRNDLSGTIMHMD